MNNLVITISHDPQEEAASWSDLEELLNQGWEIQKDYQAGNLTAIILTKPAMLPKQESPQISSPDYPKGFNNKKDPEIGLPMATNTRTGDVIFTRAYVKELIDLLLLDDWESAIGEVLIEEVEGLKGWKPEQSRVNLLTKLREIYQ